MIELASAGFGPPWPVLSWGWWCPFREFLDEAPWLIVTCVKGHSCHLDDTHHVVAADGAVTPSAVCPVPGCGWHEMIRLAAWSPVPPA